LHGDGPPCPVNIPAFEGCPFVRSEPGFGGEHDERPERGAKLDVEGVDLVAGERTELRRRGHAP
jgi:hypothetical protein